MTMCQETGQSPSKYESMNKSTFRTPNTLHLPLTLHACHQANLSLLYKERIASHSCWDRLIKRKYTSVRQNEHLQKQACPYYRFFFFFKEKASVEKLAGCAHTIGHAQDSRSHMFQFEVFVGKFGTINRLSTRPVVPCEVTTLKDIETAKHNDEKRKGRKDKIPRDSGLRMIRSGFGHHRSYLTHETWNDLWITTRNQQVLDHMSSRLCQIYHFHSSIQPTPSRPRRCTYSMKGRSFEMQGLSRTSPNTLLTRTEASKILSAEKKEKQVVEKG